MHRNIIKIIVSRIIDEIRKDVLLSIVVAYIFIVVVFAVINWLIFMRNSTSFLISEQLNKHVDRYEFLNPDFDLAAYHRNAKDNMPITIDGFTNLIKPSLDELKAINDSLLQKQDMLDSCKEEMDSLLEQALRMRADSIEQVKSQSLSVYQQRIDSLQKFMKDADSTEMILAGKYVELANLRYEYAKKKAEVQSMIVQNYGSLIPDSLSYQIRKHNVEDIMLSTEIGHLEQTRKRITFLIRDMTVGFHENRRSAVSFLDFIYYSICVSTTVSFGDIAPNNGLTRLVAIFELLICIILVSAIVDRVIKKDRE